jgi:hypothetical protein
MKKIVFFTVVFSLIILTGCAPLDEIYSHDFNSGYFKLKPADANSERVFLNIDDDSISVYPVIRKGKSREADASGAMGFILDSIEPGSVLYNSTLIKTSADIDLSSVVLKYRPGLSDVPPQLNSNINGVIYSGFRKDYFKIKSGHSKYDNANTLIRHTGFDFGLFAGIGITPVNPTVTANNISQEYDGIVFQKGFSVFATYEHMSVGLAIGFDNLLDRNKNFWIYNQKPWIGLVLGIANF